MVYNVLPHTWPHLVTTAWGGGKTGITTPVIQTGLRKVRDDCGVIQLVRCRPSDFRALAFPTILWALLPTLPASVENPNTLSMEPVPSLMQPVLGNCMLWN